MKFHIIRETWSHMAAVSGFDPLFANIESLLGDQANSFYVSRSSPIKKITYQVLAKAGVSKCKNNMSYQVSPFMTFEPRLAAEKALAILENNPRDILLLSVGESQYTSALSQAPLSIRKRIFLFLHQPPAWLRLFWNDFSVFHNLGGIFVLCNDQAEFIRAKCSSPVHVVRHGVCLDYFTPSPKKDTTKNRLLFVGQWLRDFPTLSHAIPLILAMNRDVVIDLVVQDMARYRDSLFASLYDLARQQQVNWHIGVSSDVLRDLYRNSVALLLPLMDSTANNSICEAMACGIPVITSDIGGIKDYVSEDFGILCPVNDYEAISAAATQLLSFPEKARSMGEAARLYAEKNLSWDKIAEQINKIVIAGS